jgi:hypothetical protein
VPFLRFSRDKRGYEHTYLVQVTNRRGKSVRPRILYWYRTPPGVRVGRQPFDEDVRQALEAQNPGVVFDWGAIVATPFPPPELVEPWRERRRAERAARRSSRDDDQESPPKEEPGEEGGDAPRLAPGVEAADPAPAARQRPADRQQMAEATTRGEAPSPERSRRRRGGRRPHTATAPSGAASGDASTPTPLPLLPPVESPET